MTRVGLLGYGIAGRVFHAPLIASTEGMDLVAIVTANPERQARARAAHPEAKIVTADELFELDLDLIVVGTPNKTHVEYAKRAIDKGVAVVVDKPFAPSSAEAKELVASARAKGVPLTVFQNRRWDSDFLTVRKIIGQLGEVRRFESRYERWVPEIWDNWREFGSPEEAGGLLYDLGAHLVDQALQLFGPVRSVYAELDLRRPGVQVDDDVFVALTHENGVRSHLWASAHAANNGPRFRVLGSEGAFVVDGLDEQEDALAAGRRPTDSHWGREARTGRLGILDHTTEIPVEPGAYQTFYAELRAGRIPVAPSSAVDALDVIEAAFTSARENRVVEL
ncbi:Gfo/Idh/MocA family oxidoreductase [Lentzea sp. BCCO 10_0856]|uniref:Gfo/Idh/MocA family oxidoreductase n=2 Tax=Lentzea miocenica TaxID=3095431 RepID=A0ABU4SRY8_9PSEU|nr:Gfo/Idh/MocA family oxidoreductase [Lentzea sp. BCCO 10_0856]MDX8028666.1 Gfo/Idh/MocA family oxidoreductase [Lentzea sp. BCCO 10_0856]